MIFFNRHRRARINFSRYIDGDLSAEEANRVEAHLETCESCRLELNGMRAAIDALRSLPAAEPPRSFALTPEMVQAPRPAPGFRPSPGLINGLRLATAGAAAALAIVFVIDVSDTTTGGDGASVPRFLPQTDMSEDSSYDAKDGDPYPVPLDGTHTEGGGDAPAAGDDLDTTTGGGIGGPGEDTYDGDGQGAAGAPPADRDGKSPLTGDEAADDERAAQRPSGDDGGFDTLLAIEIALGAALAAGVAGSVGLTLAARRSQGN